MPEEMDMSGVDTELEDFSTKDATYEIWILGYDRDLAPTGFEFLYGSYANPDEAVNAATPVEAADIILAASTIPSGVRYFTVEVETVVDTGEDETVNVGTIYRKSNISNPTPVAWLRLKTTDYSFTEDGALRVTTPEVNRLHESDYVTVQFLEETEAQASGLFIVTEVSQGVAILDFVS